ncbi:MAG: hypothetical protein ACK56W_09775 [Pirellula sp.]
MASFFWPKVVECRIKLPKLAFGTLEEEVATRANVVGRSEKSL